MPATMIPRTFEKESTDSRAHEEEIYNSLRDNLSSDFIVYHSVKPSFRKQNKINIESEADFIIMNLNKGIIVVEAKYIHGFEVIDGFWKDDKGNDIHYGCGPYEQAKTFMGRLKDSLKDKIPGLLAKFPITYIVWFHAMSGESLSEYSTIYDLEQEHTFSRDDLVNPIERITKILDEQAKYGKTNASLTKTERKVLEQVMNLNACVFDTVSNRDDKEKRYNVLLDEQKHVLDFLEYQPTACIQGLGGTGKTVIAVEKAKRGSFDGKTLFLCFNSELNKKLAKDNKDYKNIDFYSIDSFMGSMSYSDLLTYILCDENFDYKNVVIDEAQDLSHDISYTDDLAKKKIKKELLDDIFEAFKERTSSRGGFFYVFFDRLQCIQSEVDSLPNYISRPDCLLTLHINCRNTVEICKTSTAPLLEGYKKRFDIKHIINKGVTGDKPNLFIYSSCGLAVKKLNELTDDAVSKFGNSVVILTMKTLDTTFLNETKKFNKDKGIFLTEGGNEIKVSTVRKFKGLEADFIYLIDVNDEMFDIHNHESLKESLLMFYVGCSRAKFQLNIFGDLDQKKLQDILETCYDIGDAKKSFYELSNLLKTNSYVKI